MWNVSFLLFAILFFEISACAQDESIPPGKIDSLFVDQQFGIYYDSEDKYPTGCHGTLECTNVRIRFYCVELNRANSKVKLKGRIYSEIIRGDTIGYGGMVIYVACPKDRKLVKIPEHWFLPVMEYHQSAIFPSRLGDFEIDFEIKNKYRLYFADHAHHLVEYDIGKLIE